MAKKTKKETKKSKDSDEELEQNPNEEQSILKEESKEEIAEDIKEGKKTEDVYSDEGLEVMEDEDELEPWEEGFMQGTKDDGQLGKDALTGEALIDEKKIIETEIKGKTYRFVNDDNAKKFRKKMRENKGK